MGRSPLVYRLSDPGFTIYHRAALGGLAATIRSWRARKHGVPPPLTFVEGRSKKGGTLRDDAGRCVQVTVKSSSVRIRWCEPTTDREALALILKASFRLTDEGLIYLPGQGFGPEREDVLLAQHDAITRSFLQHGKKRPGIGKGSVVLKDEDGEQHALTFTRVGRYSHQVAQASGLLMKGEGWTIEPGNLPDEASLTQSILPGAMKGAGVLKEKATHVFLLHFLMVACPVFIVRSRKREKKVQSCLVVPDVSDLLAFSTRLERVGAETIRRHTNDYLGRVMGGAEEAALRFMIDLKGTESTETLGVSGAQVFAMGKVAWGDKTQSYRSWIARVKTPDQYPDFAVFEAAAGTLGRAKIIQIKKGEPFAIPTSPLPDLIAANLAAGGRWSDGFADLVSKKKDFVDLCYRREGMRAMNNAIRDEEDRLVIRCFQKAWSMKMGALGERASGQKLDFSRLAEVERERIRNDLLRTKTSDQLAGWLMRFLADASRGGTPREFTDNADAFRKFVFHPRNGERLRNLLLFALVSYSATDTPVTPATAGAE